MHFKSTEKQKEWIIKPYNYWFNIRIQELWHYKDLIFRLVKRDFLTSHRQTLIGPLWLFFQPALMMLVYVLVFSRVARLSTDGLPAPLFYLSGIIMWNFFSTTVTSISHTYSTNAEIFGKVYFPRIIVPISTLLAQLLQFLIQFGLFILLFLFYWISGKNVEPGLAIVFFPFLIVLVALLAFGIGLLFASLTIKYRDLQNVLGMGIRVLMFLTPVFYPLSIVPEKYQLFFHFNPLAATFESIRYVIFNNGTHNWGGLVYGSCVAVVLLLTGVALFQKTEGKAMDVI